LKDPGPAPSDLIEIDPKISEVERIPSMSYLQLAVFSTGGGFHHA
jgi:hypothetical protein